MKIFAACRRSAGAPYTAAPHPTRSCAARSSGRGGLVPQFESTFPPLVSLPCTTRNFGDKWQKCNSAISPGFLVSSAPRAIVAAPRPPATPGRIQCRLVGPKKNSWCRPGPQWSPTRVSSRLLQVALGVKRAGVSGPDGLQNAPRLRVLRTWHLRRA